MKDICIRNISNGFIICITPNCGAPEETACHGLAALFEHVYNEIGPIMEEPWEDFVKNLNQNPETADESDGPM